MALLEVSDLHAHYGAIEALKGISLTVDEGEVVTLIGSNGAGKSTTLRCISGLTTASRGRVTFAGEDITRVAPHEIVTRGIALSPEGRRCFSRMTVRRTWTSAHTGGVARPSPPTWNVCSGCFPG